MKLIEKTRYSAVEKLMVYIIIYNLLCLHVHMYMCMCSCVHMFIMYFNFQHQSFKAYWNKRYVNLILDLDKGFIIEDNTTKV